MSVYLNDFALLRQPQLVPCPAPQQAAFSDASQQTSCASTAQQVEVLRVELSRSCSPDTAKPSDIVIFVIVVSSMRRIAHRYL